MRDTKYQYNLHGKSEFDQRTDQDVWRMTREGGPSCLFHSNLAAVTEAEGGSDRVGVGISQTAQVIVAMIKHLEDPHVNSLIKPELLALAKKEAAELMPLVTTLNFGKTGFTNAATGFMQMKRQRQEEVIISKPEDEVAIAAKELYVFLTKPTSPLRSFLEIMSGGGVFYTAFVGIKTAKAACLHKPILEKDFIAITVARSKRGTVTGGSGGSEAAGLLAASGSASG